MSTQKQKFALFSRLAEMGFSYDEAQSLRRIEMTLNRWGELCCGNGNDHGSWSIERDDETGKPFMVRHHYLHGRGKDYSTRTPISDRESGALRRLAIIMAKHPAFVSYHQSDPRGCALYLVSKSDLVGHDGEQLPVDQYYTRGLAVCA